MFEQISLDAIEENLEFFNKMYDVVRIVDPVKKCVLEYNNCKINKTEDVCHNYWQNGKICDNCISIRAYHEDKSFMKLEYKSETIMMVTAIPLESLSSPVTLELLKNVTDSIMIGSGDYNEGHMMRNAVLEFNDMVIKDKLTSLYNRRYIDERLPADIIKATITQSPLSVIFVDVDDLKGINDTYGHSVGDQAIKEVGNAISKSIRADNDWGARYGGDEYIISLNNTDYDEAYRIAERIRGNIEKISVLVDNNFINFTISLGIHTMKDSKLTVEDLINLVDKKMYEAKKSGKNRTVGKIL